MNKPFLIQDPKLYNLIYSEKDYKNESEFINSKLSTHNSIESNILEIGSGTGNLTKFLIKGSKKYTALEPNNEFFKYSKFKFKNYKNVKFFNDTIQSFLKKRNTGNYDFVIANFNVMNYLNFEEFQNTIIKLNKVVSNNAIVIFDTWSLEYVRNRPLNQESNNIYELSNNHKIIRSSKSVFNSKENKLEIEFHFSKNNYLGKENLGLENHQIYPYSLEKIKDFYTNVSKEWEIVYLKPYQEIDKEDIKNYCANDFIDFRNWYVILKKLKS